mmetsp:Transcript_15131/g.14605  ORF Transcript_15131/g.14605 Transcript_15131/m.14605 type:complete len:268 (-) Transcript_15131:160-963(-)|eukprot:CAMPEP_0197832318 /NCGR_PEP_ID=MMETSP1437-20131217/14254_1 /TAXON_ID=49252 ORGANISM="Eucampia antarctica, Strain CCMP1452" /NCGR_SAMPLE_ID=MMETSP1437 /ASSEMBLY_ACC=CAM_ASM_001096 /LENGTH=267 /DNA_ID=CAMNT_0043435639 /DNA_START=150 /DNA_END=953 /DNA_ORIENTATION=+
MSTRLNELENATVGMGCGVIEVIILQPFNYAKNMIQQGQPLSMDPRKLYRGVGANCINMGSCTMIQFSVGGILKKAVAGDSGRALKPYEEMACGISAGVLSAIAGSPLELIMIQQQVKGGSTLQTISNIANPTSITRGFVGTAVREGLWTCGYLSIPPIVRKSLRENYPETFDTDAKARVPASLFGGLFACYLTHPFDTLKTCMQGDIERVKFKNIVQSAKVVYGESGLPGFYRGATFRYGRMCIAVGLLDSLQSMLGPLMYPSKFD